MSADLVYTIARDGGDPARPGDARHSARSRPSTTSRWRSRDGEFLVLVGPSGCGKSTLLRMIAGLEEVTGGEIWIGDRDVTDLAPRSRDIAMVFQTYALYPHMTVRQNMGYGLKARRDAEGGDRAAGSTTSPSCSASRTCSSGAGAALRRPAPARCDGARDRPPAAGVPARRAALEPRREAARRHARLARAAAPAARRHHRLCHARPDRGDDPRPARRSDARRPGSCSATVRRCCTGGRQPLHRGVHRLARDEPRRGDDRG